MKHTHTILFMLAATAIVAAQTNNPRLDLVDRGDTYWLTNAINWGSATVGTNMEWSYTATNLTLDATYRGPLTIGTNRFIVKSVYTTNITERVVIERDEKGQP